MPYISPARTLAGRRQRQRAIAAAVAELPPADIMVDRILATYATATPAERADGARWYDEASDIAATVATIAGIPHAHGAGIIAALSPQTSWEENIVRGLDFAARGTTDTLGDPLRKATAILAGDDPADVLGGRKVRSFWANITGRLNHVTVDRHAIAIVYGRPLSDREAKILERPGTYQIVAAAYRSAARRLGLAPATLQAITWLAWRRQKGLDYTPETF